MACGRCKHGSFCFNEVSEVLDGFVDSQKLTIKGNVIFFGIAEFLGEEGNGLPGTINALLKDATSANA